MKTSRLRQINFNGHFPIELSVGKSKITLYVNYTLRKSVYCPVMLDQQIIPQNDAAKYLGMHIDSRLNWKHHVRQKKLQIKDKLRKLYWLIGRHSVLDLTSKRLLYVAIIKPIWTYGIQMWGCSSNSNIDFIQRCNDIALRSIVAAYRYDRNDIVHRDLMITSNQDKITKFAR